MMPKTRRKDALRIRALRYAEVRKREQELTPMSMVMQAYEDGYRAAMSDARAAWNEESSHTMSVENLLRFLRPLK